MVDCSAPSGAPGSAPAKLAISADARPMNMLEIAYQLREMELLGS
jgi:hypothetical protein